jgi:hypothetical protein
MARKIVGPRRNLLNVHNSVSFGDFSAVMVTEFTGGERGSWKLRLRSVKTTLKPENGRWQKNCKYKGTFLKSW